MPHVHTWFTSEPDGGESYQSRLVFKLSCTWLLVNALVISTGFLLFPEAYLRWLSIIITVSSICAVALLLNRYRFTTLASYALPVLLYLHISILAFTGGGTTLPGIVNFVPIILTAGFLLGGKRGTAFAILCILTTLLLAYAETRGWLLVPTWNRTPLTRFVALLLPFSMTIAIQYFATEHIRQVTETIKKSEADLKAIFMATDTSYVLVDQHLKITAYNHAAVHFGMNELNRAPGVGDNLTDFIREERKPEMDKILQDVLAGGFVHYETSYPYDNGKLNYYDVRLSPIKTENGRPNGFLLALTDISEIRNAENEIRALSELMEQKVEARTRDLQQANRELEAFSYMVSHDLQAPLRVINGYGNILLQDQAGQLDEKGKELIGVIKNQVDKMSQLIKDLLAFSQFSKAPLNLKEVNMNRVVNVVIEEMQIAYNNVKTEIEVDNLLAETCDESLIKQVWANLISNAIKYSSKKSDSRVKIGVDTRNGSKVYYVKDNGAGFDMQHADKLFKVFKRLHSAREFEGTGIGLATVERIVTKHYGRIWAYAKAGEGATFYFTLCNS
jgi:PAS domain S-box-containing protein